MLGKSLIQAASVKAGAAGGLGIEELFQTWLYTGNGSTQTITNGIDLAGEGGLVWIKSRTSAVSHALFDTARGVGNILSSDTIYASAFNSVYLSAFNSDGFSLNSGGGVINSTSTNYASWTFRKAPGFFDVVTYTGNGATSRDIAHNLGSAPGCMIVKRTDTISDWAVYHRSVVNTDYLILNSTAVQTGDLSMWRFTDPNSSTFRVGDNAAVNASGGTYVAYLFAHDEQIFGEGGDQSVIKCGSYTGNGSTSGPVIDLGWEPQWVMIKNASSTGNWFSFDTMRGIPIGAGDEILYADISAAANTAGNILDVTATGFQITATGAGVNTSSNTYIYIAIRRGPMKTPTDAAEVFATGTVASDSTGFTTNFPVDYVMDLTRVAFTNKWHLTRLTGTGVLKSDLTNAEAAVAGIWWQSNTGINGPNITNASTSYQLFRRAPGFFDVVAYTGTGVARTVAHNLGVAPELMIVRWRNGGPYGSANWMIYSQATGNSSVLLFTSGALLTANSTWNYTSPTSTVFTVGGPGTFYVNDSGATYIAYLFATLPGVSKVFSFTGNGTSQTIDCGFAAGARFVLLKRTDSAGNWLVADTARGIISGNDPLLYLNSVAAEITTLDWIDPHSSGFIVNQETTANANVGGATYIGLAIA